MTSIHNPDDVPILELCLQKNIEELLLKLPETALEPPEIPVLLAHDASDDTEWCINNAVCKTEELPNSIRPTWNIHRCKFCPKVFTSNYEHSLHENKHKNIKCEKCSCSFSTPKTLQEHSIYCSRAIGLITVSRINRPKPEVPRRFRCVLCNRKYVTYKHLFDHQVKRCAKRYRGNWVVKI